MLNKRICLVFSILLISFNLTGFAMDLSPTSDFYILDKANILTERESNEIIMLNESLHSSSGAQIVFISIDSLNGEDIKTLSNRTFERWGIGTKGKDNGVLVLMSLEDREIWIEIGYGLEGALPDSKVKRIIDAFIIPEFKNDNYSEGVIKGFNAILAEIGKEYEIDLGVTNSLDESDFYDTLIMLIIVALAIVLIIKGLKGGGGDGGSGDYYSGGSGGGFDGGGGSSGGGGAGGSW